MKTAERSREFELSRIDHRSAESFNHAKEVHRPWGELDLLLAWCRDECRGEWRWQMIESSTGSDPGRYIFYFDDERDLVAFLIKWG